LQVDDASRHALFDAACDPAADATGNGVTNNSFSDAAADSSGNTASDAAVDSTGDAALRRGRHANNV